MKKEKYMSELNDIKNIAGKIRTLNEGIRFGDDFDVEEPEIPQEEDEGDSETLGYQDANIKDVNPEDVGMKELDEGGELDQIREITLKGMIQLNKTPEDPKFQSLLKIFNICNKAVNDNSEEQAPAK